MTINQDREEVLSKSKLLKSANIYVSEDLSRKTREHRNELFKYMRFVSLDIYIKYFKCLVRKHYKSLEHGTFSRSLSIQCQAFTSY